MTQDPIRYYVVVKAKGEGVKPELFNADTDDARRKAAIHLYFLLFDSQNDRSAVQSPGDPLQRRFLWIGAAER